MAWSGKRLSGLCHTLVRTEDGKVYSFGDGAYGQLGHGNQKARVHVDIIIAWP